MKNAICLIMFTPVNKEEYLDFINNFRKYTIYVVIDDNTYRCEDLRTKYNNINFIQIPDSVCAHAGFQYLTSITINKVVTGWDKAVYYFSRVCDIYDNVWFIEDDVFFYSEYTLLRLDKQYSTEDILSDSFIESDKSKLDEWFWNSITIHYEIPYYNAMMCIVRLSKKLLELVEKYVSKHKRMCFLEAFFPTLAVKNNLKISSPSEFYKVTFDYETSMISMNKNGLYHPEKNVSLHKVYRDYLNST